MESAETMGGKDATRGHLEMMAAGPGVRLAEAESEVTTCDEEDYKLSAQVNVLSSQHEDKHEGQGQIIPSKVGVA